MALQDLYWSLFFYTMALTREKKGEIIGKLKGIFKDSASVVFVNFHKLSVSDADAMRRSLRERGVGYTVAKKTLVRNALKGETFKGSEPDLPGELALAYGEDLVAPASGIAEFAKKFKESISILGGVFDGAFKNKGEMTEIAAIPPLQTLRGMFANVINSPLQGLVIALDQVAKKK